MMLNKKVKCIAHRGMCNIFPQNTIEAIQAGLHFADYVEFDIMLTKDNQVIVFHDRGLKRLTNIQKFKQFEERKRFDNLDNKKQMIQDWWVEDFTFQQLKKLQIYQPVKTRPQLKNIDFKIPRFDELLRAMLAVKANYNHQIISGLLIQIKDRRSESYDAKDQLLVQETLKCLINNGLSTVEQCNQRKLPIILQSFNQKILFQVNSKIKLPLVHLFYDTIVVSQVFSSFRLQNTIGIGITEKHLNQKLGDLCNKAGIQLFYWTVVDDQTKQPIPFGLSSYKEVYIQLLKKGVTGIITQYIQRCRTYIQ